MMIRFIGDIHGEWSKYMRTIEASPHPTIQVGDFGWGFGDEHRSLTTPSHHRWIRGNHDNPTACKLNPNYIPDGTVENGVMFIGGAFSIDKMYRTPGIDWWEDEELSHSDLFKMMDIYEKEKPEIMVTHDFPDDIARKLFGNVYKNHEEKSSRTRQCFDSIFRIHKPKIWIAGHWHMHRRETIEGTQFVCLDIHQHMDFDI